ncbi:E3 ubiquitin-protein ligase HERC2 [Symbiodinium microadriaticum]|uniref:E3 ubiquitin-protein ligase HERC2 n=1 Tax=Symbiodinium microadriaticum TaxID=2951 RepID=A0A1Q9E1Y1_SYMMI|nr:E3 ubiquitin-protein ligase HERC2 [Symbiodinium microadriaticum]
MSICIDVHLLSGKHASVEVEADASVESLKLRAQSALAVPNKCRLLNSSGEVLDAAQAVTEAELRSGDVLTLHVNQVQLKAASGLGFSAFAALLGDGSVATWGHAGPGGDSSAVQDQLRDVQQIQATGAAFAAILGDGSVVTWGKADYGGDSTVVQDQLRDVQQIQARLQATILRVIMSISVDVHLMSGKSASLEVEADVSVESFKQRAQSALGVGRGRLLKSSGEELGRAQTTAEAKLMSGDVLTLHVNQVQLKASGQGHIFAAFAALLGDGSVVTWGNACYGSNSEDVQEQLKNVQQIQASGQAFAAILRDGSVVTWGHAGFGGDSSAVQDQLRDVQQIQASEGAFAAILGDGSVVTWGDSDCGGDSSVAKDQLRDVQQIQTSSQAFAAILGDGSVVTWGDANRGGDSSAVQEQLRDVQQIQASAGAFAAILRDGSVVTWGDADYGGDSSAVQDQLRDVQQIQSSAGAFAAILRDGSVVTWGDAEYGGDSSAVQEQLRDVQQTPKVQKAEDPQHTVFGIAVRRRIFMTDKQDRFCNGLESDADGAVKATSDTAVDAFEGDHSAFQLT